MAHVRHIAHSRSLAFPDLEPVDLRRISRVTSRIEFSHRAAHDEATDPIARPESRDETARLTVYALNGMLMLMAFPVGMALLVFNILGGENIRTTAHAIALTGMGIGISLTQFGQSLLGAL